MNKISLEALPIKLAICRLKTNAPIPDWALKHSFFSITKTYDELSIVCPENHVPENVKAERGWAVLKVQGPLDFELTGILSSLLTPLAENKISLFAISTYDTDYILIKDHDLDKALEILKVLK